MKTNALTWIGFIIVGLGWVLLIGDLIISGAMMHDGALASVMAVRSDVATMAQTGIVSGFGFVLVGTLRSGFGALSRFFDAVLQRSSSPKVSPAPPQPIHEPPEPVTVVVPPPVERPRPASPPSKKRNYVILADGSVEVETMFGTRIFATLDEARDFIR